jgi:hypothetical protein
MLEMFILISVSGNLILVSLYLMYHSMRSTQYSMKVSEPFAESLDVIPSSKTLWQ